MTNRILFVCLGNICRSPAAEGVVRKLAKDAGIDVVVDSAGTGEWHLGEPPYSPMQRAALARGYDLSSLRARLVTARDFTSFDWVIGMDDNNMANLRNLQPAGQGAKLVKFTQFAPQSGAQGVPDPYYTRDFEGALDLIEQAALGFLDHLGV